MKPEIENKTAGRVVKTIHLEAEHSPRRAWYQLQMKQIHCGYIVEKSSGAAGSKPNKEEYFRSTLELAEEKFNLILRSKIKSKGPRRYNRVGLVDGRQKPREPVQMVLFV